MLGILCKFICSGAPIAHERRRAILSRTRPCHPCPCHPCPCRPWSCHPCPSSSPSSASSAASWAAASWAAASWAWPAAPRKMQAPRESSCAQAEWHRKSFRSALEIASLALEIASLALEETGTCTSRVECTSCIVQPMLLPPDRKPHAKGWRKRQNVLNALNENGAR